MEIAFFTKEIRSICETSDIADQVLGPDIGNILRRRLADIRAALSINDLVAGSPIIENFSEEPSLIINLSNESILVLVPNHVRNPIGESGEVDWSKVTRLKVFHIGDRNVN